MKPSAERNISMKELNESAAKMGLTYQDLNVGSIAIPILRGSWQKKVRKVDDDGGLLLLLRIITLFECFRILVLH
jgi:hypothetical protein